MNLKDYQEFQAEVTAVLIILPCLDEREAFAEVDALDLEVTPKIAGSSGSEDASLVDDVSAVGHGEGFTNVVVGDEDADA